jgi:outer membrane protein TolC
MEKARSVLDLARTLYRSGTADYLRVLTGLTALQDVERTLLEARRQQISHRIELCRALGGSWVDAVEPSIEEDDE